MDSKSPRCKNRGSQSNCAPIPRTLFADIRLITPPGQLISGANVYLARGATDLVDDPLLGIVQSARTEPPASRRVPLVCAQPVLCFGRLPARAASLALQFAANRFLPIYFGFASGLIFDSGAASFHAEAYVSTEPSPSFEDARVPQSYEDQERAGRSFAPSRQGPQTRVRKARIPRVDRQT